MIKLTDSSDLGWKISQEYQCNPIADDSEDQNIMNGAISKAEGNTKSKKAKIRTVKTVGRRIMLEKTNQGCVLHVEREAIGPIALQMLNNQR